MENAKKWKDTPWPWITINIMKTAQKKPTYTQNK